LVVGYDFELAQEYFTEAVEFARETDDKWRLTQLLGWRAYAATIAGDPVVIYNVAEEGRRIAGAIGNHFASRACRAWLGWADMYSGDLAHAVTRFDEVLTEVEAVKDLAWRFTSLHGQIFLHAHHGDVSRAREAAAGALEPAEQPGGFYPGFWHSMLGIAHLADGDLDACAKECGIALEVLNVQPNARGDVVYPLAEVALAQRELEQAERDAHAALAHAASLNAYLNVADTLECLGRLAADTESHPEAARLLGAAEAMRGRTGEVRFKVYDADFENTVLALRNAMGQGDFEDARAEGLALSTGQAIAYVQRGRGERKRPSSGWKSLTPTELDVVRLVSEGLGNRDIATRLFVSHRTVQTHLTHVYTKLGLSSRVQLAQESAKHA
jgi:DNA-binding NarL/FixJ family response regulator